MAVITESTIRAKFRQIEDQIYYIPKGDILTPSARQYLTDQKVTILKEGELSKSKAKVLEKELTKVSQENHETKEKEENPSPNMAVEPLSQKETLYPYIDYETGAHYMHKPEFMTQLKGNQLVVKNHKRILLRGKIDLLLSKVIVLMLDFKKEGNTQVSQELREIFNFVKAIQRAEILEEALPNLTFLGMDPATQKSVSHDPMKHYGTPHLFGIDENTHEVAIRLNELRAEARAIEIAGVDTFYSPRGIERVDLLTAFNRLSSCIYIMMLRAVSGVYDQQNSNQEKA